MGKVRAFGTLPTKICRNFVCEVRNRALESGDYGNLCARFSVKCSDFSVGATSSIQILQVAVRIAPKFFLKKRGKGRSCSLKNRCASGGTDGAKVNFQHVAL